MMPHSLDADGVHLLHCPVCGRVAHPARIGKVGRHSFTAYCACGDYAASFEWHDWVYTSDGKTADPTHHGARQMAVTKRVARRYGVTEKRQHRHQRVEKTEPGPTPHGPSDIVGMSGGAKERR